MPQDTFRWDRLIAAGANLTALGVEIDKRGWITKATRVANLDRIHHPEVRTHLAKDLAALLS